MQEKAIKKQLNSFDHKVEIRESADYVVTELISEDLEREIIFEFAASEVSSDLVLRLVIDKPVEVNLKVIVRTPAGIKGINSSLEMRALLLDPDASITFVPSLEIDERDVSVDHRSSIGAPDPEWVFYMKSRGLSDDEVLKLIAEGFLQG